MALSISDQPSHWHRVTKRHSLLNDATIDPFPYRDHRAASLLDRHIVRDGPQDARVADHGRRSTVHYLPPPAPPPIAAHPPPPPLDPRYPGAVGPPEHFRDTMKRSVQEMAAPDISEGSSSPTSTGQMEGGNQFCLCQPEPKIPRPRNAFILYRQHQQAAVVRANPGLPNPAISKIIGEQWSRLPEDAKNEWKALAEEEKARHAQQYPDYRYQPRRNGRYSSQSSGSAPQSGGQVDDQGNCKKCGGKTMNPPTTSYHPYPTTPRTSTTQMPRGAQTMVSPPQSSRPPYADRHWQSGPPPRFDPRDPRSHDPRARYPSIADGLPDAPDLKRRRFDGNGIYIPTREWREAPYQYSPRGGSFFRGEGPMDTHRPSMPSGPRASYAQPPPPGHPSRPSLARPPPPPQHKRDPSLTLPPLTTPSAVQPPSSTVSGLEAMIMSIPVLNKVKILAQISPHLAPPNLTSPPQEVRGSVVAIEGMDPTAVYSMTNSLAEELERDGKFAVRIFGGPDPYSLRDEHRRAIKRLSIAETLSVIGEWHKISEEMKRFITTKVSPISEAAISASSRKSVVMADAPPLLDRQKTPDRVMTGVEDASIAAGNEKAVEHNAGSVLSPGTVAQTAKLKLATPPAQRTSYSSRTPSISGFPTSTTKPAGEDTPYTRIPAAAMPRSSVTSPRATRSATSASTSSGDKGKQFDTAPPPRPATSSQPPTPTAANAPSTSLQTPTTSTPPAPIPSAKSGHGPSLSPSLASATPIPIALVPHYQLTTVDTAAINLPINDSYSPLAHWQWLATLWRGCIGPDVSIVIKGPSGSVSEGAGAGAASGAGAGAASGAGAEEGKSPDAAKGGADRQGKGAVDGKGQGQSQQSQGHGSSSAVAAPCEGPRTNSTSGASGAGDGGKASSAGGMAAVTAAASSQGQSQGQGVDVRLLECRAVVVRMGDALGKDAMTAAPTTVKERESAEFWEKAKRRVGFEVGEFLRR